MPKRIVITDHVSETIDVERSLLEPLGAELVVAPAADEDTLATLARSADALLVCYAPITRRVIDAAADGGVRIIARYGIGYDNVDVEYAAKLGILVTNVPDYCLDEVADHAFALLLATARQIVAASEVVRSGAWSRPVGEVHSIRGRQLALIGLGRIGTKMAERALVFGLRVVAHDPFAASPPIAGVELASSLQAAVAMADFVSLHAPLSSETRNLIDAAALSLMTKSPVLINTSRGGLVDLEAVTLALDDGRLGGVALDVTDPEPLPASHPLRRHQRAVLTPHMAFYSAESTERLQSAAADEVMRALTDRPPRSPVNKPLESRATARSN